MSFINWGHESPEQLEIRRRLEERAILEQTAAAVRAARLAQSGGVGGGSKLQVDLTQNNYVEDGYVENYFE